MTSSLALELAAALEGSALCWSREAQWHTELRFSVGQRRKAAGAPDAVAEALDPANRDPNFLLPEELPTNAWFQKLRAWAGEHGAEGTGCVLHVDVHGCQDPPRHPAHAMLGLGALRQHAEALPEGNPGRRRALGRLAALARALQSSVAEALAPVLGLEANAAATLTGLAPAVDENGKHLMTLSGAWPPEMRRLTQTQQSVSYAGVSHAIQLELSRTLRHALVREPQATARLAGALGQAWRRALAEETALAPAPG